MPSAVPALFAVLPQRRYALWLALLLAVFGALAPTVSHALAWARSDDPALLEFCTSSGPRLMALVPAPGPSLANDPPLVKAEAPDSPATAPALNHCPFCLLLADRVAPPPNLLLHFFQVECGPSETTVWQAFFYPAPRSLTPPPRGPPHAS